MTLIDFISHIYKTNIYIILAMIPWGLIANRITNLDYIYYKPNLYKIGMIISYTLLITHFLLLIIGGLKISSDI